MSSAFLSWAALAAMRALVVASVVAPSVCVKSVCVWVPSRPVMLGGSVETPIAYHADRSRRHEEVDGGAPGHAFAQRGGRDVEAWHRDFDTPPIPDRIRQLGTITRSRHDRDRAQGAEIVHAVPGVEARGRVGADDQEQLAAGRGELLDRVDRIRRALALDFDRRSPPAPSRLRPRHAPSRAARRPARRPCRASATDHPRPRRSYDRARAAHALRARPRDGRRAPDRTCPRRSRGAPQPHPPGKCRKCGRSAAPLAAQPPRRRGAREPWKSFSL